MHFLFGLLSIGAKLTKVQHLEMICTAVPQNTHFQHVGFHEHDSPATPGNVCCMPLRLLQALTNLHPSHLMEDLQCMRQLWQASFGGRPFIASSEQDGESTFYTVHLYLPNAMHQHNDTA